MTISNVWSAFFAVAVLGVSVQGLASFTFSLDPLVIQPGQRATLTLRLPEKDLLRPTTEDDVPEAQDEWLVKTDNLILLDQDYRKENGEYVWRYQFTAYEKGAVHIPPIAVTLGPQSFSSESAELTIVSDRRPEDTELRPDAGTVSAPIQWKYWILLALVALLAALAYWQRHRFQWAVRRPKSAAPPTVPPENPLDWLRKQLLILKARTDAHPEDVRIPDAWSATMREFAARKMTRPVSAWTTREMQARLDSDPKFVALVQLMQNCDAFKFSSDRAGKAAQQPGRVALEWVEESERIFL